MPPGGDGDGDVVKHDDEHGHAARHRAPWPVRAAWRLGWRAYVIPVLLVITIWIVVDVVEEQRAGTAGSLLTADPFAPAGPTPSGFPEGANPAKLPPGPDYTIEGTGEFTTVGEPGARAGEGEDLFLDYIVQIEDGVDTAPFGGADAFAATVDATLTDPVRGWTADPAWGFRHVGDDDDPDMIIQMTSSETAAKLCGDELKFEVSCRLDGGLKADRIVLNNSRWIRGAVTFDGDIGGYRHYMVNHEVGHALGYGHAACPKDGALAPVMLQQSLALANDVVFDMGADPVYPDNDDTCLANGWPYPTGYDGDEKKDDGDDGDSGDSGAPADAG